MTMPLDASVMAAVDTASRSQRVDERCGSRWGVVHTHPQAERWAAQNLQRQGYAAYLPIHTVRIRDRALPTLTRPVERPLFTSYLFVAVPLTLWGPIRHTLGVRSLLMSGEKPYLLPEAVVERATGRVRHFAAPSHRQEPRGRQASLAALGTGRLPATQPSSSSVEREIAP